MNIPEELARRENRLAAIAEAKAKIEARARERHAREPADYDAKKTRQEAKRAADKKPRGRPLKEPVPRPLPTDQVNLTDEDSRIMPMPGGGYEQCYNLQAVVAADSMIVVANDLTQATNDKQQVEPMLDKLTNLLGAIGRVEELLADHGYFSEDNVNACAEAGIEPVIATGREAHHQSPEERHPAAAPAPEDPTPLEAMRHRLKTAQGKKSYALRKQVVEPVFGIIKSVL